MEESPLIVFTLLLQAAAGAAWLLTGVAHWLAGRGEPVAAQALAALGWPWIAGMAVVGVLASAAHLGVPTNAWRAASNWRTSWLSREILAASGFTGAALAAALTLGRGRVLAGLAQGLAMLAGLALVHCMAKAYRLVPVPAWNSTLTPAGFCTTALLLGGLVVGGCLGALPGPRSAPLAAAGSGLAVVAVVLACLSLSLTALWLARLPAAFRTGILERQRFLVLGRFALALAGAGAAALTLVPGWAGPALPAAILALAGAETLGRALFYSGQLAHGVYGYKG